MVDGAIGGAERLGSIAALFPQVQFESVGPAWPQGSLPHLDILIVGADAASADAAAARLAKALEGPQIVVALYGADVATSRRLTRSGAADVLPSPISDAAVALCLERLLTRTLEDGVPGNEPGQVVAVLKAGGGVGATALAAQLAIQVAARDEGLVCLADLDLQFGAAALYLDLPGAMTVSDLVGLGQAMIDTSLPTALAKHGSGARVLAAPNEVLPLETLAPGQMDLLVKALRRDFALSLIDLPPVWTAWTHRLLSAADRILIVTQLSVPHIQLVARQLQTIAAQQLSAQPVTLVCNALSADQQASVSLRAAERSIGRPFDVVIPEDRRTMLAAVNQGLALSAVRPGTKLEKAIGELADRLAGVVAAPSARRWF